MKQCSNYINMYLINLLDTFCTLLSIGNCTRNKMKMNIKIKKISPPFPHARMIHS